MAYIKFKKPEEPSIKKNYIPASTKYNKYRRIWKIISILEAFTIFYLLMTKGF